MSTDFNIRATGAVIAPPVARAASAVDPAAVPTELPTPKAVSASDAIQAIAPISQRAAAGGDLARQVVIDRAANAIVFRVVDTRSDMVLNQYPNETKLRLRAYFNAQDRLRAEATPAHVTDRNA